MDVPQFGTHEDFRRVGPASFVQVSELAQGETGETGDGDEGGGDS